MRDAYTAPSQFYPRMLGFTPIKSESFPMTLTRRCVAPLIVTRGSDQVAISSKFDLRNDPAVVRLRFLWLYVCVCLSLHNSTQVRNYGALLIELSAHVPDGMVCFFTSYSYMEGIVVLWNEMGILNQLLKNKLLFVETPDQVCDARVTCHTYLFFPPSFSGSHINILLT